MTETTITKFNLITNVKKLTKNVFSAGEIDLISQTGEGLIFLLSSEKSKLNCD